MKSDNKISLVEKRKLASKAGTVSIIVNIFLFAIKYWAGIISGSVALVADAWHTLSDSMTSLIVVVAGKFSNKPADHDHPYGHGRIELVAAIVIGLFLAVVGYSFIEESINKIISKEPAHYGIIAIVVTIISILVKEWLARFSFKIGKRINSSSINADGWHHRSDALSSVVILVGIFFNPYFWWTDAVLGILVAFFLFYTTYEILKEAIDNLLGKKPDEETLDKLKAICLEFGGEEIRPHHFHFHDYGNHTEVTFHIQFPKNIVLDSAHDIATKIELKIKEDLFIEPTIHMEPYEKLDA